MGKASSNKKVARAARTGGGRTAKGQSTSWFWPVFIGIVVVLGTAGIVHSKAQRQTDTAAPRPAENGRPQDHWHAALGIYVCDKFMPPVTDQTDPSGIHTHGDGVVHIHPFSEVAAGRRATLGTYFKAIKAQVSSSQITIPGQGTERNGKKCGDKSAEIQTMRWADRNPETEGIRYTGDPSDLRLRDGELITIALVPEGAEIPRPESAGQLDNLTDLGDQPAPTEIPADPSASVPVDPSGSVPPDSAPSNPATQDTVAPDAAPQEPAPADTAPPPPPAEAPPAP